MGKLGYKNKHSAQEVNHFTRLKNLALLGDKEIDKEVKWLNNFFDADFAQKIDFNNLALQEWCDEQAFVTNNSPLKRAAEELNNIELIYLQLSGCYFDSYSLYQPNTKDKWIYELINQPNSQVAISQEKSTNTTRVKVNKLEF
ncbi:hypothetical protein [Mycoplasma seminis]|uniref:Uncharacterized protein n=1 Tax=Mycoplasma seminis TaxID=512749 RepID=A0ABY9HBI4_9MOLU|nr:hypothetical protein [Mycoplasma seminis]WLP85708.1 hypothetical protein Q8852_00945 [Mycoplasma seminis]